MHPTVLHEDSKLISSDFPHYAREEIAAAFPGVTVLYHTAPAGNLSPRYVVRGQTFAEAERLGRMLGRPVVDALRQLGDANFRDDLALGVAQEFVRLIPREFPSVPEAEAGLARARAEYDRLQREGAPHGPVRTAECTVFGAEETVTLAEAAATGELARVVDGYQPVEVQALRIGDTCLVGLPGEQFVEYALEIKRRTAGRTLVISLANGDLLGYIVTPEAETAGGYEATNSSFRAASGQILVDAAVGLVEKLRA
ncbi:hypothetical protein HQ590_04645, partial [bacterium]|nr:hypothetical protein [bacterium]